MVKSSGYVAFSYKAGNSFVHRLPAVVKILLIPLLNILFFNLPFYFSLILIFLQFILCFCLKFNLKEQFSDLKPVIYYAFLLYITGFIAHFFNLKFDAKAAFADTFSNSATIILLVKLFCVIQSASIIFKTSTSLQLREGFNVIESAIRKLLPVSKKNRFSNIMALFVCFVPMVYKNWEQCKKAWYARQGKKSIKMYMTIFPVFFSVGIKQAWNYSKAIMIRT